MLIVCDENAKGLRFPWVTAGLVIINLLVFLAQLGLGEKFNYGFSLVPAEVVQGKDFTRPKDLKVKVYARDVHEAKRLGGKWSKDVWVPVPQHPGPFPIHLTLFTCMFMHVGWMHLIGNMWFLILFGKNIEHAMRPGLFLTFYVVCGVASGLAHVVVDPKSVIPCMGASGAISGVLGAYLSIYPLNKVKVWMGWYIGLVEMPAFVALGIWFLIQYLSGIADIVSGQVHGGVAYWAHIGGFLAGMVFVWSLIIYLKYRQANAPIEEEPLEETEPEPTAAIEPDPFSNFLPPPCGPSRIDNTLPQTSEAVTREFAR
jgi:membrane associated rhomboid family serine protease